MFFLEHILEVMKQFKVLLSILNLYFPNFSVFHIHYISLQIVKKTNIVKHGHVLNHVLLHHTLFDQ